MTYVTIDIRPYNMVFGDIDLYGRPSIIGITFKDNGPAEVILDLHTPFWCPICKARPPHTEHNTKWTCNCPHTWEFAGAAVTCDEEMAGKVIEFLRGQQYSGGRTYDDIVNEVKFRIANESNEYPEKCKYPMIL